MQNSPYEKELFLIIPNCQFRVSSSIICQLSKCKSYVAISTTTNHTVTEYYDDCSAIWNKCIQNPENSPKLGGFGKVVEMEESYFLGQPKYVRGRGLGTSWEDDENGILGWLNVRV